MVHPLPLCNGRGWVDRANCRTTSYLSKAHGTILPRSAAPGDKAENRTSLLIVFGLRMRIELLLKRPLVLLAIRPMTAALCPERNARANRTCALDWNVPQPLGDANTRFLHLCLSSSLGLRYCLKRKPRSEMVAECEATLSCSAPAMSLPGMERVRIS